MPFTFYSAAKTQNTVKDLHYFFWSQQPSQPILRARDQALHLAPCPAKTTFSPFAPGNPICQNNWQKPFFVLSPMATQAPETFRPLLCSSTSSSSRHPSPLPTPLPDGPAKKNLIQYQKVAQASNRPLMSVKPKKKVSYTQVPKDCLNCVSPIPRSLKVSSSPVYLKNSFERKANKPISKLTLYFIKNLKIIRRKKVQDCSCTS